MEISSFTLTAVLLFLLAAMAVCLLTLVLKTGKPQRSKNISVTSGGRTARNVPAPSPKIYTGTACCLKKVDCRRRVLDENRHTSIYDEYYELIFQLQDGEMLRLSCSKAAYFDVPFKSMGTVTYCNGRLVKYKSAQVAIDEYIAV